MYLNLSARPKVYLKINQKSISSICFFQNYHVWDVNRNRKIKIRSISALLTNRNRIKTRKKNCIVCKKVTFGKMGTHPIVFPENWHPGTMKKADLDPYFSKILSLVTELFFALHAQKCIIFFNELWKITTN